MAAPGAAPHAGASLTPAPPAPCAAPHDKQEYWTLVFSRAQPDQLDNPKRAEYGDDWAATMEAYPILKTQLPKVFKVSVPASQLEHRVQPCCAVHRRCSAAIVGSAGRASATFPERGGAHCQRLLRLLSSSKLTPPLALHAQDLHSHMRYEGNKLKNQDINLPYTRVCIPVSVYRCCSASVGPCLRCSGSRVGNSRHRRFKPFTPRCPVVAERPRHQGRPEED